MKLVDGSLRLSPTDLANYAACPHLTTLDLRAARGEVKAPYWTSPVTDALRRRGEAHEAAYIEHLRQSEGLEICDLREQPLDTAGADATAAAMSTGVPIIVQAPLLEPGWAGRADVLRRVESVSRLGGWSYEPLDTKLARETRGSAILQLCAYASALENVQGRLPEFVHVVAPGNPFETRTYRLAEYAAYYRLLRKRLEARRPGDAPVETYPEPVAHCDICRWSAYCDARRRTDDHLSLVASIRRLQIDQFCAWHIGTLAALGVAAVPFAEKPDRGSRESLVRAREQARVQLEGRTLGRPVHELLPLVAGMGLLRLPEPSAGDIFFDLEGDPFVPDAGREYLFGYAYQDDNGQLTYDHAWGLTAAAEKDAFEAFVDFVLDRWQKYPDLHIYHYAPYEPSALKRLMGRFGVREDDVDRMLRAELFVDLYAVVRQGLRASVERYSIKTLEPFYAYVREMPLAEAGKHLQAMDLALEFNETGAVPAETLDVVRRYNKDDCISAARLRDWLEKLRADAIASGLEIPRPAVEADAPNEELKAREAQVRALMEQLTGDVPVDALERSHEQHARWLLAQLLEFHRREDKSTWWDYYRLCDLPPEDYLDEPCAVEGLTFIESVGGTAKCPIHRYAFPPQEFKPSKSEVFYGKDLKLGGIEAFDLEARTIDVKKTAASRDMHPTRVFLFDHVRSQPIPDTLFHIAAWVAAHHIEGDGPYRAGRDLLLKTAPRLRPGVPWEVAGQSAVDRGRRLVLELDDTVLPVQGPPGSGKTFIGAQMVCALVRAGKRVGVTGPSHKVIRNLLDAIVDHAGKEGLDVACTHKISGDVSEEHGRIAETASNETIRAALECGECHVAGGTAWLWAREDMQAAVDVLVVDEAGQMSLANVVACSRGARNVVLLGDPQQLEQPLKGSHPDGSAVSALQHILGSARTMPGDRGMFLPETRRLSPAICRFTSELFYDDRLVPLAGLDVQRLVGPPPLAGSGLWYAPVEHTGNQNLSTEEAARVADLCHQLIREYEWINDKGTQARITWADILIVAPYNSQVYEIQGRLPDARVGTVDRFQGQEAAVVIYSATTSAPEDAPRGMEFLYSLNRLNVATSRARCAVILVASPLLLEPDCQTPRQMQLVNALCRYAELAGPI
jgi:predicted RecB family nuclease